MLNFEFASGSIIGKYHIKTGKNNQDATCIHTNRHGQIVAVVCDGCGSSPYSEVGARIGSKIIARHLSFCNTECNDLEERKEVILHDLDGMARTIDCLDPVSSVGDYLLFTCIAVIINDDKTLIVSIGDGTIVLNSEVTHLGPFEGNAPPYISYNLIKDYLRSDHNMDLGFKILHHIPTASVENILIGTDGLDDFEENSNNNMPGKDKKVGPLSQFWEDDLYFNNLQAINRKLSMVNNTSIKFDRGVGGIKTEVGYLNDDTSLIVIRRKKNDSLYTGEEIISQPS